MDAENELRKLVSYAIHHLSCGYTSNAERASALHFLQRGLLAVDNAILEAAQQSAQADVPDELQALDGFTQDKDGLFCPHGFHKNYCPVPHCEHWRRE